MGTEDKKLSLESRRERIGKFVLQAEEAYMGLLKQRQDDHPEESNEIRRAQGNIIQWIEPLLETPLSDRRNIADLSQEELENLVNDANNATGLLQFVLERPEEIRLVDVGNGVRPHLMSGEEIPGNFSFKIRSPLIRRYIAEAHTFFGNRAIAQAAFQQIFISYFASIAALPLSLPASKEYNERE